MMMQCTGCDGAGRVQVPCLQGSHNRGIERCEYCRGSGKCDFDPSLMFPRRTWRVYKRNFLPFFDTERA